MKLLFTFILLIIHIYVLSQINNPNGIHFQAIARNTDGSIIPEKNITIRLSIIEGSSLGRIAYQEIKRVKTNIVGMFSVVLGANENSIIVTSGTYATINWHNNTTFIRVEVDPEGGINFLNLGIQKMNSVPYALVANSVQFQNVNGLDTALEKKMNLSDTASMLANYQKKDFNSITNLILNGDVLGTTNANLVTGINGEKLATLATGILKNNTSTGVPSIAVEGQDYLKPNGNAAELTNFPILNQNTTGKAASANKADTAIIAGNITATNNTSLTTLSNLNTVGTIISGVWSGTSISNSKLENKEITIGTTALELGSVSTSLSGISTVTSNMFIGDLTGNASLAGNITAISNSTINSLPNLSSVGTISTGTWSGSIVDISHGGTGTNQLSGILLGTNGSGVNFISTAAYGSWYDNTTQIAALANTAYPIVFNTQDFADGVSIVNNSKITFEKTGKYNIQFSAQLDRSAGTTTEYVSIWLRKNGVDVPATCTDITIQGGTAVAATVAAWNFFQNLNTNDYLELIWSATSTNIQIQYLPVRSNPIRPIIPSVILTVQQVY